MNSQLIPRTISLFLTASALTAASVMGAGCVGAAGSNDEADELSDTGEDIGSAGSALSGATCQASAAGKYCGDDMISGGSASTLYYCPGGVGAAAQISAVCQAGCHVSQAGVNDYCESSGDSCQNTSNCDDCVYYARCRKPSLPYGLFTFGDKEAIINTYTPNAGAVAVIDTGNSVGHVAYVESVSGSTITISEGNWPYGSCGSRTGTMQSLNIVGFYY